MYECAGSDRDTDSMRWITARRSAFDHAADACPANSATADSTRSTNTDNSGSDTTGAGGTVSIRSAASQKYLQPVSDEEGANVEQGDSVDVAESQFILQKAPLWMSHPIGTTIPLTYGVGIRPHPGLMFGGSDSEKLNHD